MARHTDKILMHHLEPIFGDYCLSEILDALAGLVDENWTSYGPEAVIEKNRAINYLLCTARRLESYEQI